MIHKILRLVLLGLAAGLLLGGMAGCFGGGDDEPTPDIQKTIKAEVEARQTPTSEPTEPPTPDNAATLAALMALANRTPAPPAATPVPPTAVPAPTEPPAVPTEPPTAAAPEPTNTAPPPTTAPDNPQQGPPCVITGKVTIGGADAPEGTMVSARIATGTVKEVQITKREDSSVATYSLSLTNFGETFDIYVNDTDSGEDTPECTIGALNIKNLSIN